MTTLDQLFGARTEVIVPAVLGARAAGEVRARLERAGYRRYALVDRGSYDVCDALDEPDLLAALARVVATTTGRPHTITSARAVRLSPGDYLLAHHDRVHDDLPLELVLDLSPAPVADAEVHYRRRGQVVFRMPCTPGALAIVERGPTVTCNHTYVSKRHAGASVVRLIALARGL